MLISDHLKELNLGFNKLSSLHADIGLYFKLTTLDLRWVCSLICFCLSLTLIYEPRQEKACLRGFRPGKTQTRLLSYTDKLGSWNFGYSKLVEVLYYPGSEQQRHWSDCMDLRLCCSHMAHKEERHFLNKNGIFSGSPAGTEFVRLSICPSVNFFSSHLLRDHWSDFFETFPSCSPSGLVVHAWILFAGHLWFSPLSHLLWNHWRNYAETLRMNSSQCLDVSAQKWFWSVYKYGRTVAIFKSLFALYSTLTILLSHLFWDHWLDYFSKLACDVPLEV